MKLWHKQVLWIFGGLLAVPALLLTFIAFMLFVFYPLQHKVHVAQADRANARAWETVEARVATLEVDVSHLGATQTLSADLICYKGQVAKPWDLKGGGAKRYASDHYEGPDFLEMSLEGGATVLIEFDHPCFFYLGRTEHASVNLSRLNVYVIGSEERRYCRSDLGAGWEAADLSLSQARLSDVTTAPLRTLTPRDQLKSSSTRPSSGFRMRYGHNIRRPIWNSQRACWIGNGGMCDTEMTALCPSQNS